ncbi:hypothetical protein O9K51_02272 [Purpureocillium lavendulum]|uniref:Uncharacterized protein n=1 Tax=Purpureocillium lavendulum TaxID=1247861 RepID=A0AB34FZL3_9HYPO|nr:hypothetical protein O9K51_02272 [Purpureocillium lavendulum]
MPFITQTSRVRRADDARLDEEDRGFRPRPAERIYRNRTTTIGDSEPSSPTRTAGRTTPSATPVATLHEHDGEERDLITTLYGAFVRSEGPVLVTRAGGLDLAYMYLRDRAVQGDEEEEYDDEEETEDPGQDRDDDDGIDWDVVNNLTANLPAATFVTRGRPSDSIVVPDYYYAWGNVDDEDEQEVQRELQELLEEPQPREEPIWPILVPAATTLQALASGTGRDMREDELEWDLLYEDGSRRPFLNL